MKSTSGASCCCCHSHSGLWRSQSRNDVSVQK